MPGEDAVLPLRKSGFSQAGGKIVRIGGGVIADALSISYSDTLTSLGASDVQTAIESLKTIIDTSGGLPLGSMEELRALNPVAGAVRVTLGFDTPGDGGAGRWLGVTGAPGDFQHNGGLFVVPLSGDGSEAWMRLDVVTWRPEWFGAKGDGVTDDTEVLQLMIDLAVPHTTIELRGGAADYMHGELDLVSANALVFKGNGAKMTHIVATGDVVFDMQYTSDVVFDNVVVVSSGPGKPLTIFSCLGSDAVSPCFRPVFIDCFIITNASRTFHFDGVVVATLKRVIVIGGDYAGYVQTGFAIEFVLEQCSTLNQNICGWRNPGNGWTFLNCVAEPLIDGRAGWIIQDPGAYAGFNWTFIGNWAGDDFVYDKAWLEIHGDGVRAVFAAGNFSYGNSPWWNSTAVGDGWVFEGNALYCGAARPITIANGAGINIGTGSYAGQNPVNFAGLSNYCEVGASFAVPELHNDSFFSSVVTGIGGQAYGGIMLQGSNVFGAVPSTGGAYIGHQLDSGGQYNIGDLALIPNRTAGLTQSIRLDTVAPGGGIERGFSVSNGSMSWARPGPFLPVDAANQTAALGRSDAIWADLWSMRLSLPGYTVATLPSAAGPFSYKTVLVIDGAPSGLYPTLVVSDGTNWRRSDGNLPGSGIYVPFLTYPTGRSVAGKAAAGAGLGGEIVAPDDTLLVAEGSAALAFGKLKTAMIADAQVTNAKLSDVAAGKLKGNSTYISGAPSDVDLGQFIATSPDANSGNYRQRIVPDLALPITTLLNGTNVDKNFAIGGAVWVALTAYTVGQFTVNDSGKRYICTTAGTSASSGGPTGTSTAITDGSVVWRYVETINGCYRFACTTRLKLLGGTSRRVSANIEAIIVNGVLTVEGSQVPVSGGVSTGMTLTLSGPGSNILRANVANAVADTVNGRCTLGWAVEDLLP